MLVNSSEIFNVLFLCQWVLEQGDSNNTEDNKVLFTILVTALGGLEKQLDNLIKEKK